MTQTVDAAKTRIGPDAALELLDGVEQLVVARGKKIETFDLVADHPADDTLLSRLLGPTGKLRAPIARVGKTLVVGFNADAYQQVLET